MDEHYETRRNVVKEQIEFRRKIMYPARNRVAAFSAHQFMQRILAFYINTHIIKICWRKLI